MHRLPSRLLSHLFLSVSDDDLTCKYQSQSRKSRSKSEIQDIRSKTLMHTIIKQNSEEEIRFSALED